MGISRLRVSNWKRGNRAFLYVLCCASWNREGDVNLPSRIMVALTQLSNQENMPPPNLDSYEKLLAALLAAERGGTTYQDQSSCSI